MATFYNQAQLSYNGNTINSNVVSGELLSSITASKNAVIPEYTTNDELTYIVSIVNSSDNVYTNVQVEDNLGSYSLGTLTLVPLSYISGSLKYYVNGALGNNSDITIDATADSLTVENLTVPANSNVIIVYQVRTNEYAPMDIGGVITNTVEITGAGITTSIEATDTITVANAPNLSIVKSMSPAVVNNGDQLTYSFAITNAGNAAVGDDVVISDTFDPKLTNISVVYNDVEWTEGVNYDYDESTGVFSTRAGEIELPAATFEQNTATGVVTTVPSIVVISVTGTVMD